MPNDSFQNLTILLVDDEKFSRTMVSSMLADLGRPTVLEAENGDEALAVLGEHKVDFIISDFNMPHGHGLELLRAVRTSKLPLIKPETPFALLTGYSEVTLVDLALALDANAFLVKPVSKNGLRKRLTKMLTLSQSGRWLKDQKTYEGINVDSILDEIANPSALTTPSKLMPAGQPLLKSTKLVRTSTPPPPHDPAEVRGPGSGRRPESGPIEVRGIDDQRRPDSGPVEVRGLEGQRRPDSGPIEVRGLEGQRRPDSGPIEVRGLDDQYRPEPGAVDVQGLPNAPVSAEVPEGVEVLGIEVESAKSKGALKYLCPLDELPENAVLALDIFTSHGRLFMVAGTELSPRLITMLYNLHELGHPVESIWLEYNKATC